MKEAASSSPQPRRYKWAVVAMLWFVCFFNYADRQAIYSVFTPISKEMSLDKQQLGLVGSSFMWVYALASPFAGFVGDRVRRKTLILGGLIFWSAICSATALSTQYWHLVLFRALEGFGEAFYFPASMAILSSYHGPETRSRAMSIHQSSVYVGTVAGGTLGGAMGESYGWRSSFYLLGALGVLLGMALLAFLKEPARESVEGPRSAALRPTFSDWLSSFVQAVREFLRNPMACLLMAVFMGANFVAGISLVWLPTFLKEKFTMNLALAGFSATAYQQTASILGVLAGGALADRLARRHITGRMRAQAIGLFAGVPFIFLMGWTLSVPVLAVALAGFGFFKGIYDSNIWAALHDWVRPERRAEAVGFMNSVGWLSSSLGTLAVGVSAERFGLSPSISACSIVYLAVGVVLLGGIAAKSRSRGGRIGALDGYNPEAR